MFEKPIKEKIDKTVKFAVFKIGREDFGVEVKRVIEILNMQKVHSIPELPDFLSGVITVRGEVIPLLDLRRRFGIQSSEKGRIIIVDYDGEKIGLLVNEIKEIISFSGNEITSPPMIFRGFKRKYLRGLGKKDERIIILLNIDDLLSSEEKIILKESEGMFG
ncbi:MAG: purine-binding chemotaxis protein CheW [Nitrospirae bacterium]|jgi:purine-binding chemotaxis protein CheW|nr:purine-binding chemotaxis protein CheW [Nitrospirota bacterium]